MFNYFRAYHIESSIESFILEYIFNEILNFFEFLLINHLNCLKFDKIFENLIEAINSLSSIFEEESKYANIKEF